MDDRKEAPRMDHTDDFALWEAELGTAERLAWLAFELELAREEGEDQ